MEKFSSCVTDREQEILDTNVWEEGGKTCFKRMRKDSILPERIMNWSISMRVTD
jgi:hypothetical protein